MLFYCPLESYQERYTSQLSVPFTGWLEREWIKNTIPYKRIDGNDLEQKQIKSGVVLDAPRRCKFAMSQVSKLLELLEMGIIKDTDYIYFDDFWHPGIESLFYCFDIMGIHPKMFAFCYAQSVDEYDFTHPMQNWIRPFEQGIGRYLTGIFTSCPTLTNLVVSGGIAPKEKIHSVGLIFSSEEVKSRMPHPRPVKKDKVVFSSRWDNEKNPHFFMDVVERYHEINPDIEFVICSGAGGLRSNDLSANNRACKLEQKWPDYLKIKTGLTKEQYYKELCEAKVQFNCANQDFVSFTLLEASVAGCYPVYPEFRSFPETFTYDGIKHSQYMYQHLNLYSATLAISNGLNRSFSKFALKDRAWIHTRFDTTWQRMVQIMKGENPVDIF